MFSSTAFISRKRAELVIDANDADNRILISVRTPLHQDYAWYRHPILARDAWRAILPVEMHDVDPTGRSGLSMDKHDIEYKFFDEQHALAIMAFLKEHEAQGGEAIVHCDAGISRSAAISKFIAMVYSLPYPENYTLYNRHEFTTLVHVYQRIGYGTDAEAIANLPGNYGDAT